MYSFLLLAILYGISGSFMVFLSMYQWFLHGKYPDRVKGLQRILHPAGFVMGTLQILISLNVLDSFMLYPFWFDMVLQDLNLCTVFSCSFYGLYASSKLLQVSLSNGFIARNLSTMCILISLSFLLVIAVTNWLMVTFNSLRTRIIIQVYVSLSAFAASILSWKIRKEVKKIFIRNRHLTIKSKRTLRKFTVASVLGIFFALFSILMIFRYNSRTETLEEAQFRSVSDPELYMRWLVVSLGGFFIIYFGWIRSSTGKKIGGAKANAVTNPKLTGRTNVDLKKLSARDTAESSK